MSFCVVKLSPQTELERHVVFDLKKGWRTRSAPRDAPPWRSQKNTKPLKMRSHEPGGMGQRYQSVATLIMFSGTGGLARCSAERHDTNKDKRSAPLSPAGNTQKPRYGFTEPKVLSYSLSQVFSNISHLGAGKSGRGFLYLYHREPLAVLPVISKARER